MKKFIAAAGIAAAALTAAPTATANALPAGWEWSVQGPYNSKQGCEVMRAKWPTSTSATCKYSDSRGGWIFLGVRRAAS